MKKFFKDLAHKYFPIVEREGSYTLSTQQKFEALGREIDIGLQILCTQKVSVNLLAALFMDLKIMKFPSNLKDEEDTGARVCRTVEALVKYLPMTLAELDREDFTQIFDKALKRLNDLPKIGRITVVRIDLRYVTPVELMRKKRSV